MSKDEVKKISLEELKNNDGTSGKPFWILVDGKIYNVTKYDHPGGRDVYIQNPNNYSDLYEGFMEAGHSSTATKLMKKFYVGDLED